ncbi:hypothetical protein XPA_005594 [Xanthoria parietina]
MATTADLAIIRNNFSLSTWLLLGAFIQSLIFAILPPRVAAPAFRVPLDTDLGQKPARHGRISQEPIPRCRL